MSVLITGASGFIGINLAEALLRRGEEVVLLSRRQIRADAPSDQPGPLRAAGRVLSQLPGIMHAVSVDTRDADAVMHAVAQYKPDAIVHGAAFTPGATREQPDARMTFEVNLLGTLNMLEAARQHPVRRFIFLSSGSVYGENSFAAPTLDEETVIPIPTRVYGISKYASERLSLRWRAMWDMDLAAARVGTVFGPWEWTTGIRETISAIFQMTRLAVRGESAIIPVEGRKDWIYSRDIADAIIALLDAPSLRHDTYNLGPGTEWGLLDWGAKLAEAFSGFTCRLAKPGETANVHYGTLDRSPFDVRRLAEDVGFRARFGLEKAAEDYIRWVRETPDFWEE
jgi:nucleoside-diphosphate-sugar epimerase